MAQFILNRDLKFDHFHNIECIAILIDPDTGYLVDANLAAQGFYGYTLEELLSMKIQIINQLPEKEVMIALTKASTLKKNYFTFRHMVKNGEIKNVEVYMGPIELNKKIFLFSVIFEIGDDDSKTGDVKDRIEKMDIIVICSFCHRIRDEDRWIPSQLFLKKKLYCKSHSICDHCAKENYPEYYNNET